MANPRSVYVVYETFLTSQEQVTATVDGVERVVFPSTCSLELDAVTDADKNVIENKFRVRIKGPIRDEEPKFVVEIQDFGPEVLPGAPSSGLVTRSGSTISTPRAIRGVEIIGSSAIPPPQDVVTGYRQMFELGQVTLTNDDMFAQDGSGIVTDVWKDDPRYNFKTHNGNNFVRALCSQLNLQITSDLQSVIAESEAWHQNTRPPNDPGANSPMKIYRLLFATADDANPAASVYKYTALFEPSARPTQLTRWQKWVVWPSGKISAVGPGDTVPEPAGPGSTTPSPAQRCFIQKRGPGSACDPGASTDESSSEPMDRVAATQSSNKLVFFRDQGTLNMVASYTEDAIRAAGAVVGAAGLLTVPALIIVDFVENKPVAAAFDTAGLVGGAIAGAAIGGPIGFLVGGAIAAVLSIFGQLAGEDKGPPADNVTGLLQYAFFGKASTSGVETCNQNRIKAGLSPNCTFFTGPGFLQYHLGLELFDAYLLLLAINEGYASSTALLADAFHVIDHTVPGDGTTSFATIDCGKVYGLDYRRAVNYIGSRPTRTILFSPSHGYPCPHPRFAVNRTTVIFPSLNNKTAAEVYQDIDGDCKLVSDPPNGRFIEGFNLTIVGTPVGIVCGLSNITIVNSVLNIPASNGTIGNLTASSNSTVYANSAVADLSTNVTTTSINSTDDSLIGYQQAPPQSPFVSLNASIGSYICMSGPGGNACFPNGTFQIQMGTLGFTQASVNELTLPIGAILNFTTNGHNSYSYTQNVSGNAALASSLSALSNTIKSKQAGLFDVLTNSTLPFVCLYTQTNFEGDVACMSAGAGMLAQKLQKRAMSLSVANGAAAWLYAESYGDTHGVYVSTSVDDLTSLPYQTNSNFSQRVIAMWIQTFE